MKAARTRITVVKGSDLEEPIILVAVFELAGKSVLLARSLTVDEAEGISGELDRLIQEEKEDGDEGSTGQFYPA